MSFKINRCNKKTNRFFNAATVQPCVNLDCAFCSVYVSAYVANYYDVKVDFL